MGAAEIAKGLVESLGRKGYSLQSDAVTTHFSDCKSGVCSWKSKSELWLVMSGYNWPFRRWISDELYLMILFEYDGCDINNARLALSAKSHTAWYNDKATFSITAKGAASRLTAESGCPTCCKRAAIVEFDVTLDSKYDFVETNVQRWTVRLSANGDIQITEP